MLQDFLLAAFHHLLAFGLVSMLVTQSVLLSRPVDAAALRRLAGVDRGYGIVAVLLLIVGFARVLHGIKGPDFYEHNPWFHAKVAAFLLAAVLSIWPTIRIYRWNKALKTDPAFLPAPADVAGLRRFVRVELMLIAVILICAAAMARYGGLHL
jgi:putative membrane protein